MVLDLFSIFNPVYRLSDHIHPSKKNELEKRECLSSLALDVQVIDMVMCVHGAQNNVLYTMSLITECAEKVRSKYLKIP